MRFLLPVLLLTLTPWRLLADPASTDSSHTTATADPPGEEQPAAPATPLPEDDGTRVAILGYHEFSATAPPTAMKIRTATFRKQMEADLAWAMYEADGGEAFGAQA